MNWHIAYTPTEKEPQQRLQEIFGHILSTRLTTGIDEFLAPPSPLTLTSQKVGIDPDNLQTALTRIRQAILSKEQILIFGDYDADGITATAILWETLHHQGAKVFPFIPNREAHGYGLSVKGLKDALQQHPSSLVVTVDNGVVAFEAADFLKERGIDLIITDHHQPNTTTPHCLALVHTDTIAGSAVAWMLAKEIDQKSSLDTLDLVTIGTVADMLPLVGANRSIVSAGLKVLPETKRLGLRALFEEAGVDASKGLSTYHINFVIAPRLNAMGRLEHALDSLRLLCTKNAQKAKELAFLLAHTNKNRQDLTVELVNKALASVGQVQKPIIIVEDETFHEGVIGLVAGKLVEKFYRPAIVINRRNGISKASARSVAGVNIIELIRQCESHLVNAGGHPMAAGFTIETEKLNAFRQALEAYAATAIDPAALTPSLYIDSQLELADISDPFFSELEKLKPFGVGNQKPLFTASGANIVDLMTIGRDKTHLKLTVQDQFGNRYSAIGFNLARKAAQLTGAKQAALAFTIEENIWNGRRSLQLHLKDVKPE